MQITRRIEFDAGHRIPNHRSKCRNFHGHRYRLEATIVGEILPNRGESDDGMVLDFSELKSIMMAEVHDHWDHAFLVWMGDTKAVDSLRCLGQDHRTVLLPVVPTAENLSQIAFNVISRSLKQVLLGRYFDLVKVRLFETPNCWAEATKETE